MKLSGRMIVAFFMTSTLMGMAVAYVVYYNQRNPGHCLHLTVGLVFVLMLTVISAKLLHFQHSLKHAKQNLDEAQQLAGIGSWERELATGTGYWSENHYRLFGMDPGRVAPSLCEFFMLIHQDDRELARETVMKAIATGNNYEIEYRLANDSTGTVFRSLGKILLDPYGKPVRMIGSVQDITEKHRQRALREQLIKQKEQFITHLSHDLKTPLTPLVALLPLIRSRARDDKQLEMIDTCLGCVHNMTELVEKTVKLARLTSTSMPQFNLVVLPLARVVDDVVRGQTDVIQQSEISIENRIGSDIMVLADRLEIEEVFNNLINNAIRFSPSDPRVIIDAAREDNLVTVCVKDNGIGLSSEDAPHIFDEFFKADQSRHELNSSGLGLSICRRIIENHGGRIWAESSGKEQGTAVYFTVHAGGLP